MKRRPLPVEQAPDRLLQECVPLTQRAIHIIMKKSDGDMSANREYKDTLFTKLFSEPSRVRELYNALADTDYEEDDKKHSGKKREPWPKHCCASAILSKRLPPSHGCRPKKSNDCAARITHNQAKNLG